MATNSVTLTMDGLVQMIDTLDNLEHRSRVAIVRSVLGGAVTVVARQIRKNVSPKIKDARKDARGFVLKSSKTRLVTKAKVGFFWKRRKLPPRGNRPGVGISGNNIHWWVLQPKSSPRRHKTGAKQATGTMTPQQPGLLQNSMNQAHGKMIETMHSRFQRQLKREFEKMRKRK